MTIEDIAFWGAFGIPVVLLCIGALIQKIIDTQPFKRDHFYLGVDLTVYFLASTLINFLDIAKQQPFKVIAIVWTVLLLLAALVMLFVQIGMQQAWAGQKKRGRLQIVLLCYFANGLGILLLYGFVKLKTRGLL